ncbi:ABC transporter permease [Mesorhizobium sp. WSM4887]|uniref:ABC transporter permease n=1 Tax=Mesorhizobium sp. WSM4887 TaxID=3038543 RepID=UPI0024162137|nr:ABC transporter permease [Mesorhizobium sp. WSM4887]MDG4886828.1 ABC transporter permease [Mesorhizobium sp. WSM4887]
MRTGTPSRTILQLYLVVMVGFLLLPLIVTCGAALNESRFPTVWPWRGFTLHWFVDLWDNTRFWLAVGNTVLVATGVMVIAVPIGTAAAIALNNTYAGARSFLYGLMTAPILTPGAVIGISTLMFWRALDVPAGLLITTFGQVSVIAAYVMLLVLARLQSFDPGLEEAALDLGASHAQVIWTVLLPHLRPALILGGVISFLQSTEGYNVPLFTRGGKETVMIYIASQVRTGATPMINALALILVAVTVLAGVSYEVLRRREIRSRAKIDRMARNAQAQEVAGLAY